MSLILLAVLPVFALIAIGYSLKVSGFLPLERWEPIERLSISVLYPGFLIPAIWGANLSGSSASAASLAAVGAVVIVGGLALLLRPLMGISGPSFTSVFQGVVRWNSFVFLPVSKQVFGPHGLAFAPGDHHPDRDDVHDGDQDRQHHSGERQAGTSPK